MRRTRPRRRAGSRQRLARVRAPEPVPLVSTFDVLGSPFCTLQGKPDELESENLTESEVGTDGALRRLEGWTHLDAESMMHPNPQELSSLDYLGKWHVVEIPLSATRPVDQRGARLGGRMDEIDTHLCRSANATTSSFDVNSQFPSFKMQAIR